MNENDSIYIQDKINILANHIKSDYNKYIKKYDIRNYISLNVFILLLLTFTEGIIGLFFITIIYLHDYYIGHLTEKDSLYIGTITKRGLFERFGEYYGYLVFKYYPLEVTIEKYPYFCLYKIGPLSNIEETAHNMLSKYNDSINYKLKMLDIDSMYDMSYECKIADTFVFKDFYQEYRYYIKFFLILLLIPLVIINTILIYRSYGDISIRDYIPIWDRKKLLNDETRNKIIENIENKQNGIV